VILKDKISIVTPKPQTTRHKILGILTEDNYQIIFIDTPGILNPKYTLQDVMINTSYKAAQDADTLIFMTDPNYPDKRDLLIIERIKELKKDTILGINKIDLIKDKRNLLPFIDQYRKLYEFKEIVLLSAINNDGVNELLNKIIEYLPYGELYYPEDIVSDSSERFFISEIIREKIFELYGEEIPYSTTVLINEFKERDDNKSYVDATIYVERESQKGILIGKGGEALKRVGEIARRDIESFLNKGVFLRLWVKVRKNWRNNLRNIKEFGY
jgi:GTP-binding protein Era